MGYASSYSKDIRPRPSHKSGRPRKSRRGACSDTSRPSRSVLYDALDERLAQQYRSQPPELTAIQALRAVVRSMSWLSHDEYAVQRDREQLIRNVPELRAMMLDELTRTVWDLARLMAERSERATADEVFAVAGAVIGVGIASWLGSEGETWLGGHYLDRIDRGLALLVARMHLAAAGEVNFAASPGPVTAVIIPSPAQTIWHSPNQNQSGAPVPNRPHCDHLNQPAGRTCRRCACDCRAHRDGVGPPRDA